MAVKLTAISNGGGGSFDGGHTILTLEDGGRYVMPIPKGVTDLFDNAWDTASFTTSVGKMAASATTKNLADASAGAALSGGKTFAQFVGGIGVDILQAGSTEEGMNALSIYTKTIINPMSMLMYKTPVIRQLQFTWALTPGSSADAAAMYDLIKELRLSAYPDTGAGTLKYPKRVEIKIQSEGGKILLQTLPLAGDVGGSALSSIQVNYDTEGSPYMHNDGYPVTTTLTLGIQETRMLTKTDIATMYP